MVGKAGRRGHHEGTIYQRGDGLWMGAVDLGWTGGRRQRKYVTAKTRRELQARLRPLLEAANAGRLTASRSPRVREWMTTYLDEVAATTVRPSTLHRYRQEVRLYIEPALGKLTLDKVQARHLSAFYRSQLEALSPSSVRRLHALLHKSFTVAVRWGLINANPVALVDPPSLVDHQVKPLSVDEVRRFLSAAESGTMHARWAIAVTLGLRQGEALGLRWHDIDLEHRELHVRMALQRHPDGRLVLTQPKTRQSRRTIPLPPSVVASLRRHQHSQRDRRDAAGNDWAEQDLVFTTRHGRPVHPRNDYRTFRALLQRAEVRTIRLHDLRHTAASLLLAQGVHPRVVMEILGHSQISLTMNTYSHVMPQTVRDAADRMEDALWNAE